MQIIIYKYFQKNKPEECYIGSTKDIKNRIRNHRCESKVKNNRFYSHVKANGDWSNFELEILETTEGDKSYKYEREEHYFDLHNATLNDKRPNAFLKCNDVAAYKKKWAEENGDRLKLKSAARYQQNRDEIREKMSEVWICPDCCQRTIVNHKARHLKICKGVPTVIDPDKLFECPKCHKLKGKKHKVRHIANCKLE